MSQEPLLGGDLKNCLSEVLAGEHAKEALRRVVDALGDGHLSLEGAILEPLADVGHVVLGVDWAHVLVRNNESTHGDSLGNNVHEIADTVDLVANKGVLGDHSAGNNTSEVVHSLKGSIKLLTSYFS